jgi:hypothetical protein
LLPTFPIPILVLVKTVNVVLDTANVATDRTIWTEVHAATNTIAFCIRYGLYTGDYTMGTSYEVNFLETLIELTVDLRGDFTVSDTVVATNANGAGIENLFSGGSTEGTFNQGDVITVYVEPDDDARRDSVFMREVKHFEYILLEEDESTESNTRQLAIDVGASCVAVMLLVLFRLTKPLPETLMPTSKLLAIIDSFERTMMVPRAKRTQTLVYFIRYSCGAGNSYFCRIIERPAHSHVYYKHILQTDKSIIQT